MKWIEVNQNVKEQFFRNQTNREEIFLSWFWTLSKWFELSICPISRFSFHFRRCSYTKIVSPISKYAMNLDFNIPLISFLLLTTVTLQNAVSSTIGGPKLHHVAFRNCRATVGSTNIEKLSGSSSLYKIKVGGLEENTNPLITEN